VTVEEPVTDEDSGRKVKVIDRRWFTPEGQLREEVAFPDASTAGDDAAEPVQGGNDAPVAATPPSPGADRVPLDEPASAGPSPESTQPPSVIKPGPPGFVELVDSLAQPAVAFLSGQVPGRGRDLEAARYYIDLLGVLESKTRGQLTLEEKNVLDDVLYQLRSLYVAATR
jgi:hypothetical protein